MVPHLVLLVVLAMVGTACICLVAKPLCVVLKFMDEPADRKLHRYATPLAGGLTLLVVALPLLVALDSSISNRAVLLALSVIGVIAAVGLADDRHALSAWPRVLIGLGVFVLAGALSNALMIRELSFAMPPVSFGLGNIVFALLFTGVCGVGLINAVNMADGKNGLVIGLTLGWLVILALRAPPILWPLIAVLCGCLVVLLLFNLPGKIFLGDGGSYGFASALAVITIITYNSPGPHLGRAMTADEIMLLLIVPVADSFRLTYVRMRAKRSPMSADRNHLHHYLLDKFGWPRGLLVYWLAALTPGAALMLSH